MLKIETAAYQEPQDTHEHDAHPLVVYARPGKLPPNLVILVHGLAGHRYGYWQEMPRFLFEDFPDSDIGLYYYRTAWKRANFFRSIDLESEAKLLADEVRRLKFYNSITFICHSMGGLLTKAAICSLIDRELNHHLKKISGMVFLASPLLGSVRVPSWARLFSKDGRALYPHGKLLQRLDTTFSTKLNLDQLADPREKFTIPTWAVAGSTDFWVDALSSGIGIPENQKYTVAGGHGDVSSPEQRYHEGYVHVRDCLETSFKQSNRREEELRVDDAKVSDVDVIRAIAISYFGEGVTPEAALREFSHVDGVLSVVKKVVSTAESVYERISGYLCLIPISKETFEELCLGNKKGSDLTAKDATTKTPFAIYIGAIAARDFYSRAVVVEVLRHRLKYAVKLGVKKFLTRPVTVDGLRLTNRYGFLPLRNDGGQGELYVLDSTQLK